jgi:hypothetical protein
MDKEQKKDLIGILDNYIEHRIGTEKDILKIAEE